MDICYYNSQIKEELDGAKDYIQRAITYKKEHPEWASMFAKMSEAELDHASNLVKIFEDDYKACTSKMEKIPEIYPATRKSILDMYTEFSSMVKYMHQLYQAS